MQYIASLSYGKDSIAMLEVIKQHNMPLDRIVHVEIMATDTIPADLPPMMEFKKKADKVIKERYGIEVEHVYNKETYEQHFYRVRGERAKTNTGIMYGFPIVRQPWCNSDLKTRELKKLERRACMYIGIACDEPNRFHNLTDRKISPLVEHDITEEQARKICEDIGLLSPIYTQSTRGGCWFCHNQSLGQLRFLRKQYPEYWALMLKWDKDSPRTFKPDGTTVHDLDLRFALEAGEIDGFTYEKRKKNFQQTLFKQVDELEAMI
jgi:3'-phosphoadenosine 5'-phosphosulfate sulfotransferase (PAPS reductase)/FAD synthetase